MYCPFLGILNVDFVNIYKLQGVRFILVEFFGGSWDPNNMTKSDSLKMDSNKTIHGKSLPPGDSSSDLFGMVSSRDPNSKVK